MGKEKHLVKRLLDGLKPFGFICQRHEDQYSTGIPDLSYDALGLAGSGWIEVKRLPAWPARSNTAVEIRHFTPEQRAWLIRHGSLNQRSFMFAQIDEDYLIYDWTVVSRIGHLTESQMFIYATGFWLKRVDYKQLVEILRGNYEKQERHHQSRSIRSIREAPESDPSGRNTELLHQIDLRCAARDKEKSKAQKAAKSPGCKQADLLSMW